ARLLSLLFSTLIVAVLSKNEFPNEIVVTSADVVNGKIKNIGKAGESYRLYAVAATAGADPNLVKQVSISDSGDRTFKLNDLFGKEGVYFLSENNIVTGPVKVTDPTTNIETRGKRSVVFRLTYTIYLVSTKVPALPVADVVTSYPRMTLYSNDYKQKEVLGMTVLCADNHFTLRNFEFTTDSAYVIPLGYDLQSNTLQNSVIEMTRQIGKSSFVTILGPITTVVNKAQVNGQFTISLDLVSTYGSLEPGAALSLLSPNWLSLGEQYSTSFTKYSEAFDRTFTFDKDTQFDFSMVASALKKDEIVTLEIMNQKGEKRQWKYDSTDKGEKQYSAIGSQLRLFVNENVLDSPETYPRFVVKVASTVPGTTTTNAMDKTSSTSTTSATISTTTSFAVSTSAMMTALFTMILVVQ
ncbi:hypothetical protein PMAYCL1PPCAC_16139, partial [Pristionchus mayeri]